MSGKMLIGVRSNKTQAQLEEQLLESSASLKQEQLERLKDFMAGLAGNYIPISGTGAITASDNTLDGGTSGELRILNLNLVL